MKFLGLAYFEIDNLNFLAWQSILLCKGGSLTLSSKPRPKSFFKHQPPSKSKATLD